MSKTPPEVPRLLISIQPPTIQPPVSKRGPREGSFPRNNRVNLTSNRVVVEKETTGERTDVRTIVHNCVDQTHCDRRPRLLYDRSDQNQQLENRCEATFSAPTLLQPLGIWLTCRMTKQIAFAPIKIRPELINRIRQISALCLRIQP